MIGPTVSHYKILEHLGSGGMGVVYKAEDSRLKRTVALKFLPPTLTFDAEAKARFSHEAQAASALDHPSICTIHDVGETEDGQMYLVMACYEGKTLKEKIDQEGPLDIDLALNIAIQVADGLARAHEAGIVHRDIKPANIFITTHNEVKILDFGVAKLAGQTILTKTGGTLGTAAYMSPEQARGEAVDRRTDIWSLGVVLYEMLAGRRPFESNYEQALIYGILNEDPKPVRSLRPEVPEPLEQIVLKALAKDPGSRYQKAEELLADLKAARAPEGSGMTIAATEALERKRKKRRIRTLIASGAGALLLAGVFFVILPLLQDQALASDPQAIAFASLENKTGDTSLDYLRNALPTFLCTSLEDSKYIRVTRSERMREMMKQIGKDTVECIDRPTGLLLCQRAGIDVMCVGTYTKAGPLFLAELELIDVNSGSRLGSPLRARGHDVESFLTENGIVEDLARQVSKGMGVSQMSSRTSVRPMVEVTSTSMKAQRYYQRGKLERERLNVKDARSFLELAVKEDSSFTMAWYELADCYVNLGDGPALKIARGHLLKTFSRATEREQFCLARYDTNLQVTLLRRKGVELETRGTRSFIKARAELFPHDIEFRFDYAQTLRESEAIHVYERILQLDNTHGGALLSLGYCLLLAGQGERGIQTFERLAELQPGDPNPLHSMAEGYLVLGRFDEAMAECDEVVRVKPDFFQALMTKARLHFMKEEFDEAIRCTDRGRLIAPSRFNEASFLWWRAYYLIWAGRLKEGEIALRKSEQMLSAEYGSDRWLLERISWLRGWIAYERGKWREARMLLTKWAAAQSRSFKGMLYPEFCLGLLDLQQGMMDSVKHRLGRMRQSTLTGSFSNGYPGEDFWNYYGHALHAAYLLAIHRPEEIQPKWVWAHNIGTVDTPPRVTTACWPILHWDSQTISEVPWVPVPFDIIPRAYVERGMIDSAIAAYTIALRKPPYPQGPIIPRYYYRLARLYEQKGMKEKAMENYTQFLKVWGKADPVYREPADARARLARLKSGTRQ